MKLIKAIFCFILQRFTGKDFSDYDDLGYYHDACYPETKITIKDLVDENARLRAKIVMLQAQLNDLENRLIISGASRV